MSVNLNCSSCQGTQSRYRFPCEHIFCKNCITAGGSQSNSDTAFKCTVCFKQYTFKGFNEAEGYIVPKEKPSPSHTPFRVAFIGLVDKFFARHDNNRYRSL